MISEHLPKEVMGKAVKGEYMKNSVIRLSQYRETEKKPNNRKRRPKGKKGAVYCRTGKLWVDFRYLSQRVREPSGLVDSKENRAIVRRQLDLIMAEIENNIFEFAKRFPHSTKRDFFTELEGKTVTKKPDELTFGTYAKKWLELLSLGMSATLEREYRSILKFHLYPFFEDILFSEFSTVLMKKFVAKLKSKKNRYGNPLSGKRIQNIMIPLRVIVRDACSEYAWDIPDPFFNLKLPRSNKFRVKPFNFEEWKELIAYLPTWYRLYFEFAVHTGLRPSEQVALKWDAIDDEYIHIELSRVRNIEKADLKTHESYRRIMIRPTLKRILDEQKIQTAYLKSPYVFVNTFGRPILQDKLRESWARAMKKSGLPYRRMYETRHTFASWALALGETPEWVARTLGHVDTSMVFRTYGRYIPNLTKLDGSAFESHFSGKENKKGNQFGHNFGHNRDFPAAYAN